MFIITYQGYTSHDAITFQTVFLCHNLLLLEEYSFLNILLFRG